MRERERNSLSEIQWLERVGKWEKLDFSFFSFLLSHSFILLYLFILYYSFPHSLGFPKDDTELLNRMKLGRGGRKVVRGEKSVSEGISVHSDSLIHLQLDFSKNSLSLSCEENEEERELHKRLGRSETSTKKLSDTGWLASNKNHFREKKGGKESGCQVK